MEGRRAEEVIARVRVRVLAEVGADRSIWNEPSLPGVVSMPSWELVDAQPRTYRGSDPADRHQRPAVEADTSKTSRYAHDAMGIDSLEASARAGVLAGNFGFTEENAVAHARDLLGLGL